MKKAILWINIILISAVVFSGCSKKKDDPTPGGVKHVNMKFTMNTTGLRAVDYFKIHIIAFTTSGKTTLFKINGVTQDNQMSIDLTEAQFRAGQVVVETTTPVYGTIVTISGFNGTTNHSFTYKMEPVIDGKAETVVNKSYSTTDSDVSQYQYGDRQ